MITGYYDDANYAEHGFVRARDGNIITIDVPDGLSTHPTSINPAGVITGRYWDRTYKRSRCFLRARDGTITTFDVPNAIMIFDLTINPAGDITGYYGERSGPIRGFLRSHDGK